jgi:hypothetical protein
MILRDPAGGWRLISEDQVPDVDERTKQQNSLDEVRNSPYHNHNPAVTQKSDATGV